MRIPVLTYHAMNIHGNTYVNNDHEAFRHDLRMLISLGFEVVSASQVVTWLLKKQHADGRGRKFVAITFDDGSDFDFRDLSHPTFGVQRSMFNVMMEVRAEMDKSTQVSLHATSFVIVSPDARRELDRTCMVGSDWWRDDWWKMAIRSGMLAIGNHSWDHNHPTLATVAQPIQEKGSFNIIDNFEAAEAQIAQASYYLHAKAENPGAGLFAYPYGETNDYLVREYFPMHGERIGVRAAFSCTPMPVTESSDVWALPRYVCGSHWKTSAEFVALLRDASGH